MTTPPPYRGPRLDNRVVRHDEPRRDAAPASWLSRVEQQLDAAERAWLRERIAKLSAPTLDRLYALAPDQAVAELRREMPRTPATVVLDTREP